MEIGQFGENGHHAATLVGRDHDQDRGHVHHHRHQLMERIVMGRHHRLKIAMKKHVPT